MDKSFWAKNCKVLKRFKAGLADEVVLVELQPKKTITSYLRASSPRVELYVRKKYNCASYSSDYDDKAKAYIKDELRRELDLLRGMDYHPHIIRLIHDDIVEDPIGNTVYIYTDYCGCGDLTRFLHHESSPLAPKDPLNKREFWDIFRQVASAILYCQSGLIATNKIDFQIGPLWREPFFHRDIKPPNIVVYRRSSREIMVKLCDFGLAKLESSHVSGTRVGTPGYMPPETFKSPENWTVKSDVYSLGRTMYHLLLKLPISSEEKDAMGKIFDDCHVDEPEERPTILSVFCRTAEQVFGVGTLGQTDDCGCWTFSRLYSNSVYSGLVRFGVVNMGRFVSRSEDLKRDMGDRGRRTSVLSEILHHSSDRDLTQDLGLIDVTSETPSSLLLSDSQPGSSATSRTPSMKSLGNAAENYASLTQPQPQIFFSHLFPSLPADTLVEYPIALSNIDGFIEKRLQAKIEAVEAAYRYEEIEAVHVENSEKIQTPFTLAEKISYWNVDDIYGRLLGENKNAKEDYRQEE